MRRTTKATQSIGSSRRSRQPFGANSKTLWLESPAAADVFPLGYFPNSATIRQVVGVLVPGGRSISFNIEKRDTFGPFASGDAIWSSLKLISPGFTSTSFDDASINAGEWLVYVADLVVGAPTNLWIAIDYDMDA